jgi:hypothetical protein
MHNTTFFEIYHSIFGILNFLISNLYNKISLEISNVL